MFRRSLLPFSRRRKAHRDSKSREESRSRNSSDLEPNAVFKMAKPSAEAELLREAEPPAVTEPAAVTKTLTMSKQPAAREPSDVTESPTETDPPVVTEPPTMEALSLEPSPLYQKLKKEAGQIRLLKLNPGSFDDTLEVVLQPYSLYSESDTIDFEALSYEWGAPGETRSTVQVSGETLTIMPNLEVALRHLRYADKPRVLWADAICIDQKNLEERNIQVSMMGEIYRTAAQVIVWLGPGDSECTHALESIEELSEKAEVDWSIMRIKLTEAGKERPDLADTNAVLPFEPQQILSIFTLFKRKWIERIWIRQEIRLAQGTPVLVCGSKKISWKAFRDVVFLIYHKPKQDRFLPPEDYLALRRRVDLIYEICNYTKFLTFANLMGFIQMAQCSDPRDRIYGVLSIVDHTDRQLGITPNYSLPVRDVYQDVVVRTLERYKKLDMLTSCLLRDGDDNKENMPSWVPDWSKSSDIPFQLYYGTTASGSIMAQAEHLGDGVLRAAGVRVATITGIQAFNHSDLITSNKTMEAFLDILPRRVLDRTYVGGGSLLRAYCRTVCCDSFADRHDPPSTGFPRAADSTEEVTRYLEWDKLIDRPLPNFPANSELGMFTREMGGLCKSRLLFQTREGYIGLCPESTRIGDVVAVILGCKTPIILRPVGDKQFRVVGESYVCGMMNGEAILGPLPTGVTPVSMTRFRDERTGKVVSQDSRMLRMLGHFKGFEKEYKKQNGAGMWNVEVPTLLNVGVPITHFDLI